MPLWIDEQVRGGAETASDLLAGTPVEFAGPTGVVYAAISSSDFSDVFTLIGAKSGKVIVPAGSAPSKGGAANAQSYSNQDFATYRQDPSLDFMALEAT